MPGHKGWILACARTAALSGFLDYQLVQVYGRADHIALPKAAVLPGRIIRKIGSVDQHCHDNSAEHE